jgi:hypothetical protein
MCKQGAVSIPSSLKPSLREFLEFNFNRTLIALFWATNIIFIDDEPQDELVLWVEYEWSMLVDSGRTFTCKE